MRLVHVCLLIVIVTGCASDNKKIDIVENCWVYVNSSIKFRNAGKFYESLEEIEKHNVCDKSKIRMSYFYHKGWTLYEMGEYRNAVEAFTKGLETEENYIFAYWRRGLAFEAMGKVKRAEEDYRRGYEIGVKEHGKEFFEYMEKNLDVKEKLIQNWDA